MTFTKTQGIAASRPGRQHSQSLLQRFGAEAGEGDILASVRRDLEMLLNTRAAVTSPPPELPHLQHSLCSYGIADIACVNLLDVNQRQRFTLRLEQTITAFEPRLRQVRVSMPESPNGRDRWVYFRIEANLHDGRPVVIDSKLEPVLRRVTLGV